MARHDYRFKTGSEAYDDDGWVQISNSGVGGTNQASFTVTGLTNEVEHTFELRALNAEARAAPRPSRTR